MGFLDDASAWLDDVVEDLESVTVTIRRGDLVTENVPAQRGRTQDMQASDDGTFLTSSTRDYFIKATNYTFAGLKADPRDGDQIVEGLLTFDLRPFAGEPAARYSDQATRRTWRLHVIEAEQAPAEDVLGTEAGGVLTTEDGFPLAVES